MFEELDGPLVLLGSGSAIERPEVSPSSGTRVDLSRIEAVFARLQLADHDGLVFSGTRFAPRDNEVRCRICAIHEKGILLEGDRRALDVMLKNDQRYKDTGGWGFEHFDRESATGMLSADGRGKCFECHSTAARDHVFSTIRK